jgi:sodium transport system ATP-binding protein
MAGLGETRIEVKDLVKVFRGKKGGVRAVDGVSFSCRKGEIFGLLGPNGAGKTTVLRILSTSLKPTSGSATLASHDVLREPNEVRKKIGFLSGATGLYGRLTGREMVTYFGRLHGMTDAAIRERLEKIIALFGMAEFADRRNDKLSTGQKQKVSIARTIIHDPEIMIFDEPTSGLDVITSRTIVDFIQRCREEGKCVVFSTHIMSEARKLCDRIVLIHKGRLWAEGTPAELCKSAGTDDLEDAFIKLVQLEHGENS